MNKIQTITINRISWKDKDEKGNPLISQFTGKPYKKIGIQCREFNNRWLSAFINSPKHPCNFWQVGGVKEVIIKENGQYLNFTLPEPIDYLEARVEKLEKHIFDEEKDLENEPDPNDQLSERAEEIETGDLPF